MDRDRGGMENTYIEKIPGAEWIERGTHVRAREIRTIYCDIWIDKWTVKEVDGECLEK